MHSLRIRDAIFRLGQEMKGRAIVPNVVGLGRLPFRHVRDHPLHSRVERDEPSLGDCYRFFGEIKNSDSLEALINESVDQARRAGADIND